MDFVSSSKNAFFILMDFLNALVCITAIFWIVIGIRTHSNWIQSIFISESQKIKQQAEFISEFGYSSLNTRNKLAAKKGLVFAYWETPVGNQKTDKLPEQMQSPIIFQFVTLNLIIGTSIILLIVLSKGLFTSMRLIN